MLKRIFSLFVFNLIFIYGGFTQSLRITELRAELNSYKKVSDTGLVNLLNSISGEYLFLKPDSTIYFSQKSKLLAQSLKYPLGEARAIANMARAFYVKGSYDLSLTYTLQAKSASEKINDKFGLAFAYNNIGLIHLTQNKIQEALKDFLTALDLAITSKNINTQASVYINLGIAYSGLNQPDKALSYLGTGLEYCRKNKLHNYVIMILNHMAENYYKIKKYDKAIDYYLSALNYKEYQSDWENSFAYSGIARVQLERGNHALAIENAKKALYFGERVNAKFDISRSYQILSQSYVKASDYKNAFKYLELEKLYSDSLFSEAKDKEINRLNLEQKNEENAKLQQLIDQNKRQIRINELIIKIVAGLAMFLLALTILAFRYYRQKSKLNKILSVKSGEMEVQNELIRNQNVQLEHLNKTKDQLFSIIGHDLRGPFGNMLQLMDLMRNGSISDEEMKGFLNDFYESLNDMAYMVDNLIVWAGSQQRGIKPRPVSIVLYDEVNNLLRVFTNQIRDKKIKLIHTAIDGSNILADQDHVQIIIRNLIANAVKFTPSGGSISIFYSIKADKLAIHIKDSGIGMSSEKLGRLFIDAGKEISTYGTNNEKGIGIGLMLVKQFADENGIEIEVYSEEQKGTEFVLKFKRSL